MRIDLRKPRGMRTAWLRTAWLLCAGAACTLLSACAAGPQRPLAGPDPAAPEARVPATVYRPVLSGYVSRRPVEPAPWREQNERVAPGTRE